MLFKPSDPEAKPIKRPKSPDFLAAGKFTSLPFSPRHRVFLFAVVFSLQLGLLFSARSFSSRHQRRSPQPAIVSATADPADEGNCTALGGKIFVYDLPSLFNTDLISQCSSLNPWSSRCSAVSNAGFGPSSSDDLAGVVPDHILPSFYATDQFATEVIFHRRILSHRCRTGDPSAASAFFIPFYAGLAVGRHLWSSNSTSGDRDRLCILLLRWIRRQPSWISTGGRDHFIVLGRITWDFRRSREGDWGGSFLYMPEMENVTRLLIERNPWDNKDVGIPYPTGFHPNSVNDLRAWQHFLLNRRRSLLFSFAGAARREFKDDFRGVLLDECEKASTSTSSNNKCRAVDCGAGKCGNHSRETMSLFLDSNFCLQPRGDSFTRRSMFDCMIAGSIPVLFWRRSAYVQYSWYLPAAAEEWSVFMDRRDVREGKVSVREVLEGIGEERTRRMRERVVEMMPRLLYGGGATQGIGGGVKDAVDVAVEGVMHRFRAEKCERLGFGACKNLVS